jgi:hypothetical protein
MQGRSIAGDYLGQAEGLNVRDGVDRRYLPILGPVEDGPHFTIAARRWPSGVLADREYLLRCCDVGARDEQLGRSMTRRPKCSARRFQGVRKVKVPHIAPVWDGVDVFTLGATRPLLIFNFDL